MTLKIERISGKRRTRIRLSGAFRSEHLDQLKAEIERGGLRVAVDFEEVDLVGVECLRDLIAGDAEGISVRHCHPSIRVLMCRDGWRAALRTRKDRQQHAPLEYEPG